MSNIEDKMLIKTFLLTRSEFIFRRLYHKHTPPVYRFMLYLNNGHAADTEDVMQETWIRAVEKLAQFELRSSFRTWLSGIAMNCQREHARRKSFVPIDDLALTHELPGNSMIKPDITKAISRLPAGYKEIIILHDMEGFTHKEISALLGIHEGTSKSQLFRARSVLKKILN